jgi:hypothetical protein
VVSNVLENYANFGEVAFLLNVEKKKLSEVGKCTLVCSIAVRYVVFGTKIAHNNCT